eukprot:1183379-Pleurochrysis_carterae.AAC.1
MHASAATRQAARSIRWMQRKGRNVRTAEVENKVRSNPAERVFHLITQSCSVACAACVSSASRS